MLRIPRAARRKTSPLLKKSVRSLITSTNRDTEAVILWTHVAGRMRWVDEIRDTTKLLMDELRDVTK